MSTPINDGGPAFPDRIEFDGAGNCANSRAAMRGDMSLRDWFAGQANIPWNAAMETLRLLGEKSPTVDRVVDM